MKLPRKLIWIASVLLLLAFFLLPELQYQRALWKYRAGTSLEKIEREYALHLELVHTGNYLPPSATDDEKRRHPAYYAQTARDCAIITFNDYQEVMYLQKFTPLRRFTICLRSL